MSKNLTRRMAAMACFPLSMALSLASVSCGTWRAQSLESRKMEAPALEQRGAARRHDVEQEYARLQADHAMKPWQEGNDITGIAVKYLPAGTSFADGEAILRAAGFKVEFPRSDEVPHPRLDYTDDVSGFLELAHPFLSRVTARVSLSPSAFGNYGIVARVSAGISISWL